ncbi:MAG: hypothetical protein ABIK65_10485 [Candidatus Eisenbacteria bacterium]
MIKWKRMIAVITLGVLLLPCVAVAGQAPGVQDRPNLGGSELDVKEGVGAQYEMRGTVSWFQNLFWYQIYALLRWVDRWSVFI